MTQKQTAFVVVTKNWIDSGARYFVNNGEVSRSETDTHILIGEVEDTSSERGLWLKNIKTTGFVRAGAPDVALTMKVLIPWASVLSLGLVDDEAGKTKLGYCPEGAHIWAIIYLRNTRFWGRLEVWKPPTNPKACKMLSCTSSI